MNNLENCKNDLRKFYYLPPFNESCNIVAGDGFFSEQIFATYTLTTIKQAMYELKPERVAAGYLPVPGER